LRARATRRRLRLQGLYRAAYLPGALTACEENRRTGIGEIHRSFSKKAFVGGLKKLVPEIEEEDVVPIAAGVRAQALKEDGALVDDFLIEEGKGSVHVLNAPSPAATASIPIGEKIAKRVTET
jgi:(S)-2-hydroxyglutarate dehydrogenase